MLRKRRAEILGVDGFPENQYFAACVTLLTVFVTSTGFAVHVFAVCAVHLDERKQSGYQMDVSVVQ